MAIVSKEEIHYWKTMIGQVGNFVEAPGDGTHSCVYKSGLGTGKLMRFYLNAGGKEFRGGGIFTKASEVNAFHLSDHQGI